MGYFDGWSDQKLRDRVEYLYTQPRTQYRTEELYDLENELYYRKRDREKAEKQSTPTKPRSSARRHPLGPPPHASGAGAGARISFVSSERHRTE